MSAPSRIRQEVGNALRTVFSFEATFVLFLFAGIYKADPRFAWVPVDLTGLFACVSAVAGIHVVLNRDLRVSMAGLTLCGLAATFAAYAALSLLWSPSRIYGPIKVLFVSTLVLWALAGATLIVAPEPLRLRRLSLVARIFATWVAWETILAFLVATPGASLRALGGSYLGLGRVVGVGVIFSLTAALYPQENGSRRWINLSHFAFLFGVMLVVGGRGPLLALLVALSIPAFRGVRLSQKHILTVEPRSAWLLLASAGFLSVVGYLIWIGDQTFATVRRLAVLLTAGGGASASERIYYYRSAIAQWLDSPVAGNGIGSWPVLAYRLDGRGYPHNLVLEILAELGVVGLGLLTIVVGYALRQFILKRPLLPTETSIMLGMLFVGALLNAMVTGDLADNRFLFATLGLLAGVRAHERHTGA